MTVGVYVNNLVLRKNLDVTWTDMYETQLKKLKLKRNLGASRARRLILINLNPEVFMRSTLIQFVT
jgi:hypothetical protein